MIRDELHEGHYLAEEGKVIVPKERDDDSAKTESIWLGKFDSIDNYEEIDKVDEEIEEEGEIG